MTQSEVARKIGVSRNTVSRALRGEDGISDSTRRRIMDVARKVGLPMPPVRKLAENGKLRHLITTIGQLMAEEGTESSSPFHARLLAGLRRGARECACELVHCSEPLLPEAPWPAVVLRNHVDGVILVAGDEHTVPSPMSACPVPQVYLFRGPQHADVVTVDGFGGSVQLGEHLASMGHRRVAFLGPDTWMARERLAGLRARLELDGGACPADAVVLIGLSGGHEPVFVDQLLAGETHPEILRRRFTAIACYNDWTAVHAIKRLKEMGIRVPEDISVTGFDDVQPAWYDGPKLTTCAVPLEEIGAEAVRLLYWRLDHPNAMRRKLMLEVEVVKGASVRESSQPLSVRTDRIIE